MDVRQLRYFLAVVDHGGISAAAVTLRIAQPSLSQAIASLERELGVPLFHRAGRGIVLTSNGSALVGPARVVLRDMEDAAAVARDQRDVASGRLDLITMPTPGVEPLATLGASFLRSHPDVRLNVNSALTAEEVIESVTAGENELGLVGAAESIRPAGLLAVTLKPQPFLLISAPDWHKGPGEIVDLAEISGLRLVVSQHGGLLRDFADRMIAAGVDARIVAEVGHRSSILPLVSKGAGQALLPSAWRSAAVAMGADVRTIVPEVYLRVTLIARADRLTPAARRFLEIASESVG